MAQDKKPYPSRVKKKSKSSTNSMLNVMIGLVFALILIVGAFIFLGQSNDSNSAQEPETVQISPETEDETDEAENGDEAADEAEGQEEQGEQEEQASDEEQNEDESDSAAEEQDNEENNDSDASEEGEEDQGSVTGGTITRQESNDPVVKETIINTSWEPIGTTQSGEHVSVYDTGSIDWQEKVDAITYATGLAESEMYIMHIGNGGSPQKSIGTVQSKDNSQKYRVHLEWVENEGWKPVKMDILNTVEGAY